MKTTEIHEFLMSLGVRFSSEGLNHYMLQCQLVAHKMMNPDVKESNFITLVYEENWVKALHIADTRNKEAFQIRLYQKFVEYVKQTPAYISKMREDRLNKIL